MSEETRLSGEQMKLLSDLEVALKCTSDQVLAEVYTETTPEHARGYLDCFVSTATDEKILLAYFILRMVMRQE